MALSDFVAELDAIVADAKNAFAAASDADALEVARVEFVGAKAGKLKAAQKGMGSVDKTDKPAAGKRFNEVKGEVEAAFAEAQQRLAGAAKQGKREAFDPTVPGKPLRLGRLHPITQTIAEMRDIMGRLGFTAVEGPEIEDDWHNFVALNIPETHPARDPLDNFYLSSACGLAEDNASDNALLMRSQTSTVQIRVMEECVANAGDGPPPPVRIISLGRVYRPDTADATHYPMFHQIEGLLVDKGVTMADLKSVLRLFCQSFYQIGEGDDGEANSEEDIHVRFRPSFFPFTEPSVEVDINWQGGWMEIGGAGMVDPNVLRAVGYDPEEVTGFAFGLGVERIAMRRHNITDIRALYENDVRFLEQF